MTPGGEPVWAPDSERVNRANLTAFLRHIRERRPSGADAVADFPSLYRWSVERPDAFWPEVWRFGGVVSDERPGREPWDEAVVGLDRMAPPDAERGPRWFTGARLNFAENLLRFARRPSGAGLPERARPPARAQLSRAGGRRSPRWRRRCGGTAFGPGDRVAGFLPNLPEAVIAMLGAASLGAIWSSCSPDFGANGVLDRFGQIRPRILICRRRLSLRGQAHRFDGAGA